MEDHYQHEQLPSGKLIIRHYQNGLLVDEHHYSCGGGEIAIRYDFTSGAKVAETYFVGSRMVSRRTYEKARIRYPEMPAADSGVEDLGAGMLRLVSKERKQRTIARKQRTVDPEEARKSDEFCSALMASGKCEDAVDWIRSRTHTLGERDWKSSNRLVERLAALGSIRIYACDIVAESDGFENTGHLVIELPSDSAKRAKILCSLARLVAVTGYDTQFDDGQRFLYVKLD